ncbi:MAG: hypothetical protein R2696_10320 [Microthrixaceae bacterium]
MNASPSPDEPSAEVPTRTVGLTVDGRDVEVVDDGISLLDALRGRSASTRSRTAAPPRASADAAPCWSTAPRGWRA